MYKGKSVNAIIQARMGSTRLPGKVLKKLGDKEVLGHVVDRLKKSDYIDNIVVATTTNIIDDVLKIWSIKNGVDFFRGSEDNVLNRYYACSVKYSSDIICRVTADCPLVDYNIIDRSIALLVDERLDFVSMDTNKIPRGIHGAVLRSEVLEEVSRKAFTKKHKEHVTYYIYEENDDQYRIAYLTPPEWLIRNYRLTLDTEKDYLLLKEIYRNLSKKDHYLDLIAVIEFLDRNPWIAKINSEIKQKKL